MLAAYFYGITIAMYWDERDHQVAHFHAEYGGDLASIALDGTAWPDLFRHARIDSCGSGRNCTMTSCSTTGNEHTAKKPSTQSHRSPRIDT